MRKKVSLCVRREGGKKRTSDGAHLGAVVTVTQTEGVTGRAALESRLVGPLRQTFGTGSGRVADGMALVNGGVAARVGEVRAGRGEGKKGEGESSEGGEGRHLGEGGGDGRGSAWSGLQRRVVRRRLERWSATRPAVQNEGERRMSGVEGKTEDEGELTSVGLEKGKEERVGSGERGRERGAGQRRGREEEGQTLINERVLSATRFLFSLKISLLLALYS